MSHPIRPVTLLISLAFGALLLLGSAHRVIAHTATTLVVTKTADTADGSCNSDCSLREAIIAANSTVGVKETIQFNIPYDSAGCSQLFSYCEIQLATDLPTVTDAVVIDGYSQPGAQPNTLAIGNDAHLTIVLKNQSNASNGLILSGGNSLVKGLVLQSFSSSAIVLYSDDNVITGNFVGTKSNGLVAIGNGAGIGVTGNRNTIGGSTPDARNLISGNKVGVSIFMGKGNRIQGNYLGTDRHGLNKLANQTGIWVLAAANNTVGGKGSARNLISGNTSGIVIEYASSNNLIRGNDIGLGADGSILGNFGGIAVVGDPDTGQFAFNNRIVRNRIAGNFASGIGIGAAPNDFSVGNTITRNAIYNNNLGAFNVLGMDIFPFGSGPNPNDKLDADDGPNHLQNSPALKRVSTANGTTTVKGVLKSAKNKSYRVEFFVNAPCQDNNFGEGEKYWGFIIVTTNAKGVANFTFVKNKPLANGAGITATATEIVNNKLRSTSEFSNCRVAQ